jgi:hypothetical protein
MAEESGPSVRLLRWCGMATGVATDSATSEDDEVSVIRLKSRAAAPVPNPANWVTTKRTPLAVPTQVHCGVLRVTRTLQGISRRPSCMATCISTARPTSILLFLAYRQSARQLVHPISRGHVAQT